MDGPCNRDCDKGHPSFALFFPFHFFRWVSSFSGHVAGVFLVVGESGGLFDRQGLSFQLATVVLGNFQGYIDYFAEYVLAVIDLSFLFVFFFFFLRLILLLAWQQALLWNLSLAQIGQIILGS